MKILITGGTGLLGRALIDSARGDHRITALYFNTYELHDTEHVKYRKLDVRDRGGNKRLFEEFKPEAVIHAAGVGSPDYAERHKDEVWQINVEGTRNIIENCRLVGTKFIYISSNGIYDGKKTAYKEEDAAEPINYYGQVKLEGEKITKESALTHAIVRPILMYGWNYSFERSNIVTFALSELKKNKKVFAYDDVFTNPLFVRHCASAIWKMIEENIYDIFNIAGKDRMSIYELVKKAAEAFGLNAGLVMPVKQGFFNELVKRPIDTSYNTGKMRSVLGIEPLSVEIGLRMMKDSGQG